MKKLTILILIFSSLIFFSCADKPTETTTLGSVCGTVFDQSNNSELSGVTISIQNIGNRTTNNQGYYEFLDLEEDTYTLVAEKAGYVTETAQVEIEANTNKEVNFTLHAALPAQLLLNPTNLNFGQTVYNLNLAVNNGGDEELSWQVTSDQSWLTTFPTTGTTTTEEDQVTVTVNRGGLAVGNYTGNLSFTSNGGDFNVPIQMEVTPIVLIINPLSLDFGEEETELSFEISNTGNGTLNWSLTPNQNWLSANPTSGSLTNESEIVTVNVDRSGLTPDTYNGSISITSNGGNQDVNVTMIVPEGPAPILQVNTTSLDFGDNLTNLSFMISNTGDEVLNWNISDNQTWIEVSQTNGSTNPNGSNNINVTVDRNGLTNGTHTGEINITSDGGDHTINVSLNVTPAQLIVNPTSLDFGEEQTSLNLTIENSGFEMMNWSLISNQNWLTANPYSGSLSNNSQNINVTVDRTGLNPDTYTGSISITSNGGNQDVNVTMIVPEGPSPILQVNTNSLDFGDNLTTLSFVISNIGDDTLNWNISDNQAWIEVSQTNGSTNPNGSNNINVTVDRTGLANGTHTGEINVTSDGGDHTIDVSLNVTPAQLIVNPTSLDFGEEQTSLNLTIENSGFEMMNWSLTNNQNWLSANPISGSLSNNSQNIAVTVDRTGLAPNTYNGSLSITSNGGNQNVNVTMVVPVGPITVINPNGGENIQTFSTYTINWDTNDNTENVKIELWKGNEWYSTVYYHLENTGSYDWYVIYGTPPDDDYRIKITSWETGAEDYSDNYFSIYD